VSARPAPAFDVVVVGAGPNGLAAANVLALAGLSTLVVERAATFGGGCRSEQLTLPGFVHDVCSSVHPLGLASPLFRSLQLERYGLEWVHPDAPLAHVLADGRAVTLERSVSETAAQLGGDGEAYRRLMTPFVPRFDDLTSAILGPISRGTAHPFLLARFGLHALQSMRGLARRELTEEPARALLAGIAAHAMVPLDAAATSSFGLVLGLAAHAVGWPIARGGSQAIADALVANLRAHNGELQAGLEVKRLEELPPARAYVLDVTPRQLLAIAGDRLPPGYRKRLERFRYGPGVFKIDWALREPIPWKDPACGRAATVHLSGSLDDITRSEALIHRGELDEQPFVLLVQPTLFDRSRAPAGGHVAWAYCHVPHGSSFDASDRIEAVIERAAPGFRDVIAARCMRNAREVELHNPNYVGGDINGGLSDLGQLFFRPMVRLDPYATPAPDIFLCSSSTPPGGGVHGMCGYYAARSVLRRAFGRTRVPATINPQLTNQWAGQRSFR
jgi:phytoene dehydrogenase-like protein